MIIRIPFPLSPASSNRILKQTFTLRGHTQSVSGIQACGRNKDSSKVYTCSWDHSLKEWDIEVNCIYIDVYKGVYVYNLLYVRSRILRVVICI